MTKPIEQHAMQLERTHPSGVEEWCCPTCGRRMVLNWSPFETMILERGNPLAQHSGGKGGLEIVAVNQNQASKDDSSWPEALPGTRILS